MQNLNNNNKNIWHAIYILRNLFAVFTVWGSCFLGVHQISNFIYFLNALLIFEILCFAFCYKRFISFIKKEKERSKDIIYFSRLCWWICIILLAIYGWTISAIIWFSAWFIIYNSKKNISSQAND